MSKIYALLVAIENYPDSKHKLNGCLNDLDAFKSYLEQHCQQAGLSLHALVIVDSQATREGVIGGFEHFRMAQDGDQCLFFFAGHGSRCPAPATFSHIEQDLTLDTLVCWDSRLEGGRDLLDKELSWLIWQVVKGKDKRPFISIVDSCHSGRLRNENEHALPRTLEDSSKTIPISTFLGHHDYIQHADGQISPPQGRRIHLGAARDTEQAKETLIGNTTHGAFTFVLVDTLNRCKGMASYQSLLDQVNLRVRRMVSNQSPQLDTTLAEDRQLGFLSLLPALQQAPFSIIFDRSRHWYINTGSIHGIQSGTQFQLIEDNHIVSATQVDMNRTEIMGMEKYDPIRVYPAKLFKTQDPPFKIGFSSDSLTEFTSILEAIMVKLPQNLWVLSPKDPPDFILQALPSQLTLLKQDGSILLREVISYQEDELIKFTERFAKFIKWMQIQSIQNLYTQISSQHFDVSFYRVIEAANYDNSAAVEKIDLVKSPVLLPYLEKEGSWHKPAFKLSIKNKSKNTLWFSLLYLTADFSISNQLLTKQVLNPDETLHVAELIQGYPYEVIPVQVEDKYWSKGIKEIEESLKLFICTEEFSTDAFCQEGIETDFLHKEVDYRDTASFNHVVKKDWRTLDIWLRIKRMV